MLNKWGKLYLKYLEEKKPDYYKSLLKNGELEDHVKEKQEYAMECFFNLQEELKRSEPLPKGTAFLETVQYNSRIGKQAEEIIRDQLLS